MKPGLEHQLQQLPELFQDPVDCHSGAPILCPQGHRAQREVGGSGPLGMAGGGTIPGLQAKQGPRAPFPARGFSSRAASDELRTFSRFTFFHLILQCLTCVSLPRVDAFSSIRLY